MNEYRLTLYCAQLQTSIRHVMVTEGTRYFSESRREISLEDSSIRLELSFDHFLSSCQITRHDTQEMKMTYSSSNRTLSVVCCTRCCSRMFSSPSSSSSRVKHDWCDHTQQPRCSAQQADKGIFIFQWVAKQGAKMKPEASYLKSRSRELHWIFLPVFNWLGLKFKQTCQHKELQHLLSQSPKKFTANQFICEYLCKKIYSYFFLVC